MNASSSAVAVDQLEKRFGQTVALNGLSFAIAASELFGFVGPDGGGKTTLFRILATLLIPDTGSALSRPRRRQGLVGPAAAHRLHARTLFVVSRSQRLRILRFFASVFGTTVEKERPHIAPIYSQLEPFKDRRAAALSGGMKQKLALCCALVHRPEILFLDEPTTGVDAVSRREFWDLLAELKKTGMTILVSTPYMDEADRCDRVALIQGGRLLALDTPLQIAQSFDRPLLAIRAARRYPALLALRESPHAHNVYPFGDTIHYVDARVGEPAPAIAVELRAFLTSRGFADAQVEPAAPTVEDSFIARMGTSEGSHAA